MRSRVVIYSLKCLLIIFTSNVRAQWVQKPISNCNNISCLIGDDTNIYAGTQWGVFKSTDNGDNWISSNSGIPDTIIQCFALNGENLFVGTMNHGVFLSTNNGANWIPINTGLTDSDIFRLAVNNSNIFAGTWAHGVFLSTNNGSNWFAINNGLTDTSMRALAVRDNIVFAGTSSGVFLSTNNGQNWTPANTNLTDLDIRAICVSNTDIFVGTDDGHIFLSTNDGLNWSIVDSTGTNLRSLIANGANLFAGTLGSGGVGGGVFFSTNNGQSWTTANNGLTSTKVYALLISGSNIFAGTTDASTWKCSLSQITSAENSAIEHNPKQFILNQNYPNPFNPTTTIEFSLSKTNFVKLDILDCLGREVSTLVSEKLSKGRHQRNWSAEKYASGVYYCRLIVANKTEVTKLVLLR